MKYVAAFALLQLAGNAKPCKKMPETYPSNCLLANAPTITDPHSFFENSPAAKQIQELIVGCNGTVDTEKLNAFVASVNGRSAAELIALGQPKLVSASGAASSAPVAAAVSAPAAVKKAEPVKEEPKEEEFEGAGDLFDF